MTPHCRAPHLLLRLALAALLLAPGATSAAQESQQSPPATDQQSAPQPVPGVEIPSRVTQSRSLVQRAEGLRDSDQIAQIEAALREARDEIDAAARQLSVRLDDAPTSRALEDDRRQWQQRRSRLTGWQSTIASRWERVQALQRQLAQEQAAWTATIDSMSQQETASPLLQSLREVLVEVRTARAGLDERLGRLLNLQARVAAALEPVDEALTRIQGQIDAGWLRLFEHDGAPIWSAILADNDEPLLHTLGASYRESSRAIASYATTAVRPILRHLLLIVVVTLLLRWMRTTRDGLPEEERPPGTTALDYPISAAYLIVLPFAERLHPGAPSAWSELMLLLAVVPLARTAFRALPETVHRPVRWTIVLFSVYLLLTPSNAQALLTRLVLIAFTPPAVIVFASIAHRLDDPDSGPWRRMVRLGMQLGAALLAVSLLGAAFGWAGLSWLLADATVRSAYVAMILATVGRIVVGLVEILPDTAAGTYVRHLRTHRASVTRSLRTIVRTFLWAVWIYYTLAWFGLMSVVLESLNGILDSAVTVGTITLSLRSTLGVLAILAGTGLVSQYVRFLMREEIFDRRHTAEGESNAILTIVHYVVVALGILIAGSAAGLNATQLTVVAGALGVGIGFGLQAIVNNFVSGLILVFERPVSVGDRVEVGTYTGIIERVGIRASVLRTYAGAEIVIPNADLITKEVTNWTLSDARRRVDVPVGVAYGTDTTQVLEIMEQVARAEPLIIEEPEPMVFFRGFGDSSLNFELFCWCNAPDIFVAASKISLAINQRFAEAGIAIPFPQRDLHLRSIEPGLALDGAPRPADDPANDGD